MDSKFLKIDEFIEFGTFSTEDIRKRSVELNSPGVYAFVLNEYFPRLSGLTDILYIGQAGSSNGRHIYNRMIDYCLAYESAPQDKRISDLIQKVTTKVRIGRSLRDEIFNNKVILFYKNLSMDQCKEKERELLQRYFEDHTELPPFNRSN